MNANDLIIKAQRAVLSARLLLEAGDADGACNRAYYAMFDAARAALIAFGAASLEATAAKTHNGLISAFSLHLVKTGHFQVELGRAFNRVEEIRLIADYKGDPIEMEQAVWAVQQAELFVQTIQIKFMLHP